MAGVISNVLVGRSGFIQAPAERYCAAHNTMRRACGLHVAEASAPVCLGHHCRDARFSLDLIRSGCAYSLSMKPPPACPQHEAEYEQSICSSQRPCDSLKWLAFGCDAEPGGNKSCRDH